MDVVSKRKVTSMLCSLHKQGNFILNNPLSDKGFKFYKEDHLFERDMWLRWQRYTANDCFFISKVIPKFLTQCLRVNLGRPIYEVLRINYSNIKLPMEDGNLLWGSEVVYHNKLDYVYKAIADAIRRQADGLYNHLTN